MSMASFFSFFTFLDNFGTCLKLGDISNIMKVWKTSSTLD